MKKVLYKVIFPAIGAVIAGFTIIGIIVWYVSWFDGALERSSGKLNRENAEKCLGAHDNFLCHERRAREQRLAIKKVKTHDA